VESIHITVRLTTFWTTIVRAAYSVIQPDREDMEQGTGRRANPGSPKPSAYAYQQAAGGNGSLELLTTVLE